MKRQRKQELAQTKKRAKKASEKERRKARKAFAVASRASTGCPNEAAALELAVLPARPRAELNQEKRAEYLQRSAANFSVIVDCAWKDHLVGRPLISLAQQILFCYGVNRRATSPCNLYVTGISASLREQLDKSCMVNWIGVYPFQEDYIDLPLFFAGVARDDGSSSSSTCSSSSSVGDGGDVTCDGRSTASGTAAPSKGNEKEAPSASGTDSVSINRTRPRRLVYLTSDAEETLETLDTDTAYIIGGIVDRNSLKGATFAKASVQGVRTAKLPIKENMEMAASHVLTVNHVFEILLHFSANGGNWREAIARALPQRKGAKMRDGDRAEGGDKAEAEASSSGVDIDGETGEEGTSACEGGTEDNREEADDDEDGDL